MGSEIKSFEDLFVYQKAREFSRKIAKKERYVTDSECISLKEEAYSLIKILNNYLAYLQKAKAGSRTH